MPIHIHSEHFYYKHKKANLTKSWLKSVIRSENKIPGEINIVFMGDEELRKINVQYLKHDCYTDVISFEYNIENAISGDIFISFDRIIYNSKKFDTDPENEVYRVIVHGLLHLIGYDDKTENEIRIIREKENFHMGQIVNTNPK